ncbi:MAG: tetratricopeptide repeat protein [Deltaproteobacteria bacterium]|nr:tetratricopeptide repeat protein [Deltaproteobacteria bacterium]
MKKISTKHQNEAQAKGPLALLVKPLPVLILLALVAVLIYSNTFSSPFHFDDRLNLVENPQIKNLANFRDFSGTRYVGFLSFALNYHFGGLNVFGYHLVNILIHITNGFLVYSLILLLFAAVQVSERRIDSVRAKGGYRGASGKAPDTSIALATALLFIAHPVQTQAITYIVQRFASLMTLFYLLALVCYLKWRFGGRLFWYVASLTATVLAMKTKENSFTLPFMILAVEMVFFKPLTIKQWKTLIPFLLTLSIIPLSQGNALGEAERFARDTTAISRVEYLFTQFRVIVTYLRLLVFPINQNLDYDYPIYHSLFDASVATSFIFIVSLLALAVNLFRGLNPRLKLIAFGILWFFLTLSIESSIIPISDVIFEHRVYLPSIGLFTSVGASLHIGRKWISPKWGMAGIGIVVLLFSTAAYRRNAIWKDDMVLWRDVVAKAPKKARPNNNLAVAYKNKGMLEAAIRQSHIASDLDPNYADAHGNLGGVYDDQGRYDAAIQEYLLVLKLEPNNIKAYNNLGIAYKNLGRLNEAIEAYQMVLKLQPGSAMAHSNLGNVYADQGRYDAAVQEYNFALKLDRDFGDAHYNLANAYAIQGRLEVAIHEYRMALKFQPENADAHYNLGTVYMSKGNREAARKEFEETLKIKSDYAEARRALDELYK